jgi:NAD(P)-dependent dehydrogenase (short-subunit alcohol dehydrogenase family)
MTLPNLRDSIISITGAGSGIGRAAAIAAANAGATGLVLNDIEAERLAQTADQLRSVGADVRTVVGSIADPGLAEEVVDVAVASFGRLDGALNNAGTRGHPGPITSLTDEDWRDVFDTAVQSSIFLPPQFIVR